MTKSNHDFIEAATFLHKELSPNIIEQLKSTDIGKTNQHFSLGMTARNILRRSDIQFDDVWLDDHWYEILQKAIKQT